MHPRLVGLGTALPPHSLPQSDAMHWAAMLGQWPESDHARLATIYRRSTIERRASVLLQESLNGPPTQDFFLPPTASHPRGPTTAQRFARFEQDAPPLAARAARDALTSANVAPTAITHLIVVSCTGSSAPGVDAALVPLLGLRNTVERTFVGFMGCAGAISGLGLARSIAAADPAAYVLVVSVELCSLHLQYSADPQQVVANALFADASAAAVVTASPSAASTAPRLVARLCALLPSTEGAMTWRIGDHGLAMSLSPRVPDIIARSLRPAITEWLGNHNLTLSDIASWAIHPGGPRVIDSVSQALDLTPAAAAPSRAVLRDHGNMSSATLLFVHQRGQENTHGLPCVWLGFSPGLTVEALLLT